MKLYYSPGACSLNPHIILRETNTPFTLVKTDLKSKTVEDGSDFFAVNPMGYVPALRLDDGTILTEGPAITQYIADTAGATHLAPAWGTLPRYKMLSWLNFVATELHKSFGPLFNAKMPADGKAYMRDRIHDRLKTVDAHLGGNAYLMGADFMLPDAYLFAVLNWCGMVGIDLTPYPNVRAFQARVAARPTVQAAMKAEGLLG